MDKLENMHSQRPGELRCGRVHIEHFQQLITLSGIHSPKVIMALEGYLVLGMKRKDSLIKYNVSASYFSIALRRLQNLSLTIYKLLPWYISENL